MTFRATAGGLDAATMAAADARYLKLAADNDPLTGTLATQAVQPDADSTRDIGTAALRYKTLVATQARLVSGNGTVTQHANANVIGRADNSGGGGGAAEIHADGAGSLVLATVDKIASGTHSINASATGAGSSIAGKLSDYYAYGNTVTTSGPGSSFSGYSKSAYAAATSTVSGAGASAFGYVVGNTSAANLTVSGPGGFFSGIVSSATATVGASGGSFIGAAVTGGTVTAGTTGSTSGVAIFGSAVGVGAVLSGTANGAFVAAYVAAGQTASATASNAAQFGVGTNAQADSLSVGTQLRLKGTTGAPTTPRNGDLWVASSAVNIRTVGVNLNLNRPTVTGSRVAGAALTDLLAKLSTMNLILDSTTA